MNKLALAVVALVVIAAAVFLLQGGGVGEVAPAAVPGSTPDDARTTNLAEGATSADGRREAGPGLAPIPAPASEVAEPERPAPGKGAIEGIVRYAADGTPAVGIAVHCEVGQSLQSSIGALRFRTGKRGEFGFGDLEPGQHRVVADRGGEAWVAVVADKIARVELEVPAGATVVGVVRDMRGGPIAAAEIWLSERNVHDAGAVAGKSGADGRFELRHVPGERWIGAHAPGYQASALRYLKAQPGETTTVEILLAHDDARVTGQVLMADGRPASGAAVFCRAVARAQWSTAPDGSPQLSAGPRTAVCDGEGRFRVVGLPPGDLVVQARAAESGMGEALVTVTARGVGDVVVNLPRAATLSGRVTENGGPPTKRVVLFVHHTERTLATGWLAVEPDGTFSGPVSPGTVPVQLWQAGHVVMKDELVLVPGETRVWNPVIAVKGFARGRVVDAQGRGLEGFSVAAFADDKWLGETTTSATGEFALDKLDGDRVLLRVGVRPEGGAENSRLTALTQDVTLPVDALELVIPADRVPNAGARGRVLSPAGAPIEGALVRLGGDGGRGLADAKTAADGTFALGRLVPGPYWVTAQHTEHPPLHLGRKELSPGAVLDLGDLTLLAGGTVVASVQRTDGGDTSGVRLYVNDARGARVGTLVGDAERRSGPLPPGELLLEIGGTGIALARHPVVVVAGQETRVQVVVQPGRRYTVHATVPAGSSAPRWVAATLFDAERHVVGGFAFERDSSGVWVGEVSLGAGHYTLTVGSEGQTLFGQVEIDVAHGGGEGFIPVSLQPR